MKVSVYDLLDGNYSPVKREKTVAIHKPFPAANLAETKAAVREFFAHLDGEQEHYDNASFLQFLSERGVSVAVDGSTLRVWDHAKYGSIEGRFSERGIDFVIVKFHVPTNPPSNEIHYLYLAEGNNK